MTVLICVSVRSVERIDKKAWEVSSVCFLSVPCSRNNNASFGRETLRKLTAGAGHVDDTGCGPDLRPERGKLGFGVSPDVRYKDGEEKADFSYRQFLAARKAFIEATGQEPEKDSDVMRYLAEYPVQLRVIRTEDGENLVVAIRSVRG